MSVPASKQPSDGTVMTREFTLMNKLGLHARPAARFVRAASAYKAEVVVEKDGEEVNGKSIMGLMMLAAGCGSRLRVTATGADADRLLDEIEKLIARQFDEE